MKEDNTKKEGKGKGIKEEESENSGGFAFTAYGTGLSLNRST